MIDDAELDQLLSPLQLSSIDTQLIKDSVKNLGSLADVELMQTRLQASNDYKGLTPRSRASQALNVTLTAIKARYKDEPVVQYQKGDVKVDTSLSEADQLIQIKANQEAAWGKENIAENEAIFKSREEQAARYAEQDKAKFTSKPDPDTQT